MKQYINLIFDYFFFIIQEFLSIIYKISQQRKIKQNPEQSSEQQEQSEQLKKILYKRLFRNNAYGKKTHNTTSINYYFSCENLIDISSYEYLSENKYMYIFIIQFFSPINLNISKIFILSQEYISQNKYILKYIILFNNMNQISLLTCSISITKILIPQVDLQKNWHENSINLYQVDKLFQTHLNKNMSIPYKIMTLVNSQLTLMQLSWQSGRLLTYRSEVQNLSLALFFNFCFFNCVQFYSLYI
ncbi:hypothetical protein pb186bvf_015506 [Paramecium bursaria]